MICDARNSKPADRHIHCGDAQKIEQKERTANTKRSFLGSEHGEGKKAY